MRRRTLRSVGPPAVVVCLLLAGLTACSDDDGIRSGQVGPGDATSQDDGDASDAPSTAAPVSAVPAPDAPTAGAISPDARSAPRADSYYPEIGSPTVDALHYGLGLSWSPDQQVFSADEVLTFRATESVDSFSLDFGEPLQITSLTLDGDDTDFTHEKDKLTVEAPVTGNQQYELALTFSGTPEQTPVPTQRGDFSSTGFTITDEGEVWTMQEPWGAFTWYAVNDHPSDKAAYDFRLAVPAPWTGVANGDLLSTEEIAGNNVTEWHLEDPAASYLTTLAFGDYEQTDLTGPRGLPIRLFTPAGEPVPGSLERAPEALRWLEKKLGPYPFSTAGVLVVDSESGMETQTMITLGDSSYATSMPVLVHEFAHHWYGDTVTPSDWSDVWMNEGMAMFLQGAWEAEDAGITVDEQMDQYATFDGTERTFAGPPAAYDKDKFGSGNIYYGPALMWDELRKRIGDRKFYALTTDWPADRRHASSDRADYFAWLEKETGLELSSFFDDWLLGDQTPPRT